MSQSRPGMTVGELFAAWGSILSGRAPMLSIEITRECPLSCPGCYAYGDSHLGGEKKLTELSDLRGDALVAGVLGLVKKHRPRHVSLVGGEPMIRHRELSRILPALSQQNIFTMVVTSGIIPIPMEWMGLRAEPGCCFHRRTARAPRPAPQAGNLRSHPGKHPRPRSEHSLDDHRAHDEAPGISRRISGVLAGAAGSEADLGEPLQSAARRTHAGNADHGRAATGGAGIAGACGKLIPSC